MDFWYEKEVSAEREEKDAIEEPMELKAGIIKHIWILHPKGSYGLLHTQILEHGHVLAPAGKGGSYHGNGYPMEFDEEWEIKKPATLVIKSWNLDDTYPHTVYIRVTVMHKRKDRVVALLEELVSIFKRFLGS